jgi:chromosome segregation ATPase
MIESIMYFVAGFLVASLLGLALISAVHHRAVRLTRRSLEDSIPVSLTEIRADRDKLRAHFAMSIRRLEVTVEQLEAKVTGQLGEIARKSEAIAKLKAQLAEKNAAADELGVRLKRLSIDNREAEQGYAAQMAAAEENAQVLAARVSELAKAALEASELAFANETQRVEIVMLKTQLEQLKTRIEHLEREAGEAKQRLSDERVTVSKMTKALEELEEKGEIEDGRRLAERVENEFLRERIADIAAQVAFLSMNEAGSPIAAILKEAAAGAHQGGLERSNGSDVGQAGGNSIVERLGELQAASRVPSAS